jgi:hypothetical protein
MKRDSISRIVLVIACVCGWALTASSAERDARIEDKAVSKLKAMSTFVTGLKSFRFQTDETLDGATEFHGQNVKVQYSTRRTVSVKRPDKLFITLQGDISQRMLWLQAGRLTIYDSKAGEWTAMSAMATPEATMLAVRNQAGMVLPLGALIFGELSERIQKRADYALYLGKHDVRGQPAHHLLFAAVGYTWQLWIADGDRPLPIKFVVTDTSTPAQPQYSVWISDWDSNLRLKASLFVPDVPKGAKQVDALPILFGLPVLDEK